MEWKVCVCAPQIVHQPLRVARVAGRLADKPPHPGRHLHGVLLQPPAPAAGTGTPAPLLLHPDDLPAFTKLHRGRVTQRQVRFVFHCQGISNVFKSTKLFLSAWVPRQLEVDNNHAAGTFSRPWSVALGADVQVSD